MFNEPLDMYGYCWRTTDCVLVSTHNGPCKPKPHTVQCGYVSRVFRRIFGERCELAEGHEARHQSRNPDWDKHTPKQYASQWKAIDGVENPYSLKRVSERPDGSR